MKNIEGEGGKKEFPGRLEAILPEILVGEKSDDMQNFFLILGLIFNDLKGLLFFRKLIGDIYREPKDNEITAHAGEHNGLINQINRLVMSTVSEFFIFIDKNKTIINSQNFLFLLERGRSPIFKKEWKELVNLDGSKHTLAMIARVRSNTTFHYDHSGKELRRGFRNFFDKKSNKTPHRERAYYSLNKNMEQTRIYYSDAAAQGYVNNLMKIEDMTKIINAVERMTFTLQWLLKTYHDSIDKGQSN